jgi:large subunit ribosomal protein L2
MGKRIIQQARGKGSMTYRVRKKAFSVKPQYVVDIGEEFEVVKLLHSAGHTAPLAKLKAGNGKIFYNIAAEGIFEGEKIKVNGNTNSSISVLGNLKNGTKIFNIEARPCDGGKFIRSGGNSGTVLAKKDNSMRVLMPSKKEKVFDIKCRATVGEIAGGGRVDKPILKAGKQYYIKKAKSKLWPRTSAVKMNAIDHPFGSGRGKRIKSKIAKRNSPPGRKVGLLRPRRTGRKKK